MVCHMKTTLNISDSVMERLRLEAARQGRTMSELVESALRMLFAGSKEAPAELPPLPSFSGGRMLVDVADRNALFNAMEQS